MARSFRIAETQEGVRVSIQPVSDQGFIEVYRISIDFPGVQVPSPVRIEWEEPMENILCVWHPMAGTHHGMHQWFAPTKCRSRFCEGAPILTTVGEGGLNRQTVTLSDVKTPCCLSFCIRDLEQKDKVGYAAEFFTQKCDALKSYSALLRIDLRGVPYYESVMSVSQWWAETGAAVPSCLPAAEDALYSSWYNFHQAPDGEMLLADLRIASELGFKTVILDDGWQFDGPSSGHYSTCGEWLVAAGKFADFRRFTDEVHSLGMKLMVWFAVPFIGDESPLYARFEGKYLYCSTFNRCMILDPRYPEVREYLIGLYRDFLEKYDIDGFKLDFIDAFAPGELTGEYNDSMDCRTIEEAVERLLTGVTEELSHVKPGLLYEYRQNYVGPAINRFGNMLRVADCAYDAMINRVGVIDLRMMNYPIAVHSDMLFWSPEESVRLCARQLNNILFSVPQISVLLQRSTEEQLHLLRHYISYWTENRDLILHGRFRALHPEMNYTFASSENDDRFIAVQYADLPYTYTGKPGDLFHNGETDGLVFENPSDHPVQVEAYDCMGRPVHTEAVPARCIRRLPVPVTGMLRILP